MTIKRVLFGERSLTKVAGLFVNRSGAENAAQQVKRMAGLDDAQVTRLHADRPDVIVHCGFGFGMAMTNMVLASLDWDPPRYMSTAFENASRSEHSANASIAAR